MKKTATNTVQVSGLFHGPLRAAVRAAASWPMRMLTLAVLVLAAATFGGVFAVAHAQQADGAISGLTLTSDAPGTLAISWIAPDRAPTDYRVNWARADESYPSWTEDTGNRYPLTTSLQLTGLDQGVEYKVQVRARYRAGADADSPWSGDWLEATMVVAAEPEPVSVPQATPEPTPEPTPTPERGAIGGPTVTQYNTGHVRITWPAPPAPHHEPTDYRINWARSADEFPSYTEDDGNAYPDRPSYLLGGLQHGAEYKVRIRARYSPNDQYGASWSGPWREIKFQGLNDTAGDSGAPAAPQLMGTACCLDGQVIVLWQGPEDDSVTGYRVLRGSSAESLAVIVEDTGANATTYTDTSPLPGQTNAYAVQARNATGLSPISNVLTATAPASPESEPDSVALPQHESEVASVFAVGNLGSASPTLGTAGNYNGMQFATAFTTGSLAQGYNLTGVGLKVSTDAGVALRVSIYNDSGAVSPNDGPGMSLQILVNPDELDQDLNTIEVFAVASSTPAASSTLAANTKYWVVLEHTGGRGYVRASAASTVVPDEGSLSGWSIGTTRMRHNDNYNWQNYPRNMAMEVRAGELEGFTLDSVEVTSKPLDGDTYKAGENLEILFTFDTPVKYVKGVAGLTLGEMLRGAGYMNGSGTDELRYRYRVSSGDSDVDGLAVRANSLSSTAQASILTFRGSPVTLEHAQVEPGSDHKVNGGEKGCAYVFCTDVEVVLQGEDAYGAIYYTENSVAGVLSNRLFRYGSTNYQVRQLLVRGNSGRLELLLDREPEADLLSEGTLHVGTRFFHFNDATLNSGHRLVWPNSGLTWNVDDHVRVSLQDNILVSNFTSGNGISDATISTSTRAQAFTTGPRENGYRITEVRLRAGAPSNTTPRVAIHSDSSGLPGTKLLELTNPTAIAVTAEGASFTSLGLLLEPNTAYWAVVDRESGSGDVLVSASTYNGENDGSATGWSIADSSYQLNGASWTEQTGEILQIAIEGWESAASSSAPEFPDKDGNGTADPITFTVAENVTVDTRVGVVEATDSDNDTLIHSVGGTDAADFNRAFVLDVSTGAITVKTALDYEAKSSYSVLMRVTDGRDASGDTETTATIDDTVRVTIYVRKVSEPVTVPPIADLADKVLLSNYAITLGGSGRPQQITMQSSGIAADVSAELPEDRHEHLDRYIRVGMPFTTGPDTGGYELGMVRLPLRSRDYEFEYDGDRDYSNPYHPDFGKDRNIPQVSIWSISTSTIPGARLHVLVGSRDLSQRDNDFYSDGFTLMPETKYWVVVETLNVHHNNSFPVKMDGLFYTYQGTGSNGRPVQDDMTAEGWSIGANVKKYYSGRQEWCKKALAQDDDCIGSGPDIRLKMALFKPFNASAPFFRNADGNGKADPVFFRIPEDTASGASVGRVVVYNFDGDDLTFAVSGDSSAFDSRFLLGRRTGEITLKPNRSLNYETQRQTYTFDVTVHDGEDSEGVTEPVPTIDDVTTVTIQITNVNEPGSLSLTTDEPRVGERMVATLTDDDGGLAATYWVWSCGAINQYTQNNNNRNNSGPGQPRSEYTPRSENAGKQCNVSVGYRDAANQYEWLSLPFRPRAE